MRQHSGLIVQKRFIRTVHVVLMALLFNIGLLCLTLSAYAQNPEERATIKKKQEMLYPIVQLLIGQRTGSGIVIYSGKCKKEEWCTYIQTNHHVIETAITKTKKEGGISVIILVLVKWSDETDFDGKNNLSSSIAEVVAHDADRDLAVLRLFNHKTGPNRVVFFQSNDTTPLDVFDTVFAVGAGLTFSPFPTSGIVSYLSRIINGNRHIQASPPVIYGNSGGGLFRKSLQHNRYEMVGIFTRIPSTPNDGAITHMGFFIPIETIREFLKKSDFNFILKEQERLAVETRVTSD